MPSVLLHEVLLHEVLSDTAAGHGIQLYARE